METELVFYSLGHYIKYLRDIKEMSLKELENRTGINSSYINRLERKEKAESASFQIMLTLLHELGGDINQTVALVLHNKPIVVSDEPSDLRFFLSKKGLSVKQAERMIEEVMAFHKSINDVKEDSR